MEAASPADPSQRRKRRSLLVAGGVIGVALGGFFDGILLHQILQWHHLLSLVPGEALRDVRNQVLADGAFHVLMYLMAGLGLWLLWRARDGLVDAGAGRRLAGSVLVGFGLWQLIDVVIFHWIAGIHRIRVDVENPLAWDIGWLVALGVPPTIAGFWLARQAGRHGPPAGGSSASAVATGAAALTILAAAAAALPPAGTTTTLVLFRQGVGSAAAFEAVAAVEGRIVWADPSGAMLAVEPGRTTDLRRLYAYGALLVSSSPLVAGCVAWMRT